MSFDLNINTTCNHVVFRELSLVSEDRHSIRITKPIGSTASVKLYAAGNFLPPSLYSVVNDPNVLQLDPPKMLWLKEKWRSPSDWFEVTYVTLGTYCPKCTGLKVLNDIGYNIRGSLSELRDEALLMQNAEKWVITWLRSNPFHSFIGTSLISLIGGKITDVQYLTTKITQEINNVLKKFMDLQDQYRSTGRKMSDGETLSSVDHIEVTQDTSDPTILRADVTLTAKSGKSLNYQQYLKLPQGIA